MPGAGPPAVGSARSTDMPGRCPIRIRAAGGNAPRLDTGDDLQRRPVPPTAADPHQRRRPRRRSRVHVRQQGPGGSPARAPRGRAECRPRRCPNFAGLSCPGNQNGGSSASIMRPLVTLGVLLAAGAVFEAGVTEGIRRRGGTAMGSDSGEDEIKAGEESGAVVHVRGGAARRSGWMRTVGSNSARGSCHRAEELGLLPPRGSPFMCACKRWGESPERPSGSA
jgi:hypothetical protein